MAEIVRRRSWGGVLPFGRQASTSSSRTAHCASLSISPPRSEETKRQQSEAVQATTGSNGRAASVTNGRDMTRNEDETVSINIFYRLRRAVVVCGAVSCLDHGDRMFCR